MTSDQKAVLDALIRIEADGGANFSGATVGIIAAYIGATGIHVDRVLQRLEADGHVHAFWYRGARAYLTTNHKDAS